MTLVDERPASAGEPRQSRRARFGRGAGAGERVRQPLTPRMRRRRRRLLLASLPVVVLAVLVALKLLSLNLVHSQTLTAYQEGDKAATMTWGERQGWVNIVEQFRSPFAIGDAHLLTGHYDLARPWFEQAFEQVPKGGIDDCKVRVNLGLTYEALGDAAKARERTDEWQQYYAKGIKITSERPPLCDLPEGQQTGDQLQQAQQRMQEKNSDTPAPDQPQEQGPQAGPADPVQPTPDPGNTPSQEEQDYLQEQQRQNTIERNQQQGNDDRTAPDGGSDTYPKPW